MLGDHLAINANWSRMAFISVSPFARYSVRCKSSINDISGLMLVMFQAIKRKLYFV